MFAATTVIAYLLDFVGVGFAPTLACLIALAAGGVALASFALTADWDRADLAAFAAIVGLMFGWLMWIARPSFLPLGSGPDLTHHLLLIQYIERQWRLRSEERRVGNECR